MIRMKDKKIERKREKTDNRIREHIKKYYKIANCRATPPRK